MPVMGPTYIFALNDKSYNFWKDLKTYVDLSPSPYFMEMSPAGWDDIAIQNIRNRTLWAVDRNVTIPLTYLGDGAKIIKHVTYKKGHEEPLYLSIAVRRTWYEAGPTATGTGLGSLVTGTNTGTITGNPGETIYVKVDATFVGTDSIFGNIGGSVLVNMNITNNSKIFTIVLPPSGTINFNLSFSNSFSSTSSINITTATGNLTGTYGYYYKRIYRGEVNLVDFVHNNTKVTCTTVEDGLSKYIKSNLNTIYELPMNVRQALFIKWDGLNLDNTVNFGLPGITDAGGGLVGFKNLGTIPLFMMDQEGDGYGLEYLSVNIEQIGDLGTDITSYIASSNNWQIMNTGNLPVSFTLSGRKKFSCTNPSDVGSNNLMDFYFIKSDGTKYYITQDNHPPIGTNDFDFSYSFNITLNEGEKLFPIRWFHRAGGGDSSIQITYDEDNSFDKVVAVTRRPYSFVRHLTGAYIMNQVINKLTEGEYMSVNSTYLDSRWTEVFTCGNAIRGFDDAVFQTSLQIMFKYYDAGDSVGLKQVGTNNVVVDRKQNLIDKNNFILLGNPAYNSLKFSMAKDYLFNELEIGYAEIKSDIGALNGNQEPLCKYLYSLGTVKNPFRIDKVSPIKSSPYEQEKIRTTILQKTTTDYKSDNDLFVNDIDPTLYPASGTEPAYYMFDRSLNPFITAGLTPSAASSIWNLKLTPGRMRQRNSSFFRSCTYKQDNWVLGFRQADRNSKLVCDGLIENSDMIVGNMDDPYFIPWYIDGEWPVPDNLLELLDSNPLQVFKFPIMGTFFMGIINKVSIAHSTRKVQQLQFLSVSENDLEILIDYYGQ